MKIGVFSKLEMAGGSEFRVAEMANAIARHTKHEAYILAENKIPSRINDIVRKDVGVIQHVLLPNPDNINAFYDIDILLIINTDSKTFTQLDYWQGKSERHGSTIDISRFNQMIFLFNFLVSPSRHLYTIETVCKKIKIICTNTKFYHEITSQDRYELVRHYPRIILESPIDPDRYDTTKTPSTKIRFGMHSKSTGQKWNEEWPKLIKKCNERLGDRISFDFMGMNSSVSETLKDIPNTTIRKENEISVREYLNGIDIFIFFPSWKREEPWARVVGEAMMSGCPIIATNKGGNSDQVLHGNNGFLAKNVDAFLKHMIYLVHNNERMHTMSKNAIMYANNFSSKRIVRKFIEFIEA